MAVLVEEFLHQHGDQIKHIYGFSTLVSDFEEARAQSESSSNAVIAKRILSNAYGHECDDRLSIHFKRYALANTTFIGRPGRDSAPKNNCND